MLSFRLCSAYLNCITSQNIKQTHNEDFLFLTCRKLTLDWRPENGQASRFWLSKRGVIDGDDDRWNRNLPLDGSRGTIEEWMCFLCVYLLIWTLSMYGLILIAPTQNCSCIALSRWGRERRSITTIKWTLIALQLCCGSSYITNYHLKACQISRQLMQQPLK